MNYSDSYALDGTIPPHIYAFMLLLFGFVALIAYVVSSVFQAFLFRKMGIPMWKAWVPFYSSWTFLEAANLPGAWSLLAVGGLLPFIGGLFSIAALVPLAVAAYRISVAFSRDAGLYTVLFVFAPPVYCAILGLSSTAVFDPSKLPARPVPADKF